MKIMRTEEGVLGIPVWIVFCSTSDVPYAYKKNKLSSIFPSKEWAMDFLNSLNNEMKNNSYLEEAYVICMSHKECRRQLGFYPLEQ